MPDTSQDATATGAASVRTNPPRVHPARAIAFRVAAHSLDTRRSLSLLYDVVSACGMPNVPAPAANLALHARLHGLDRLQVTAGLRNGDLFSLWGPRRMPYIVGGPDVLVFGLGALPDREDALRTVLGGDQDPVNAAGLTAASALAMVAAAITEALRQAPMTKGELSAALHGRLPVALEPWCGACRSNHVPESLFRMGATAAGALGDGGDPERFQLRTQGLAEVPAAHLAAARLELVRRFLRCFGPAGPQAFAAWAGTGVDDAMRRWTRLGDELVEMDLDGPAWVLHESI
ncbi:MAG: winged helix DNA-binding domain-containing protein, partial [Candidatus Dormibacteraeota bacterium]|nr:winged helix DNA-binding domain-containing protein [Candidatus Dormibacteraeota bacterium]